MSHTREEMRFFFCPPALNRSFTRYRLRLNDVWPGQVGGNGGHVPLGTAPNSVAIYGKKKRFKKNDRTTHCVGNVSFSKPVGLPENSSSLPAQKSCRLKKYTRFLFVLLSHLNTHTHTHTFRTRYHSCGLKRFLTRETLYSRNDSDVKRLRVIVLINIVTIE